VHHSTPARAREPLRATRSNEVRPQKRPIKRRDGAGPWPGAISGWSVRPACSSGHGTRASWHDVGCSVGRCASTQTSWKGSMSGLQNDRLAGDGGPRQNQTRLRAGPGPWQPSALLADLRGLAPDDHDGPRLVTVVSANAAMVPTSAPMGSLSRCPHYVDNDVETGLRRRRRCR